MIELPTSWALALLTVNVILNLIRRRFLHAATQEHESFAFIKVLRELLWMLIEPFFTPPATVIRATS